MSNTIKELISYCDLGNVKIINNIRAFGFIVIRTLIISLLIFLSGSIIYTLMHRVKLQ